MCVATVLKEELNRLGIRHEDLAHLTNYSRQSVTAWANGRRRLPEEAREKLAQLSPNVALEIMASDPANIFITGWLDGEVDLTVMAVTAKLVEELQEAMAALAELRLVNKSRPEHLTQEDRKALGRAFQEILDVMTAVPIWAIKIAETYEVGLLQEVKKHQDKLVRRHNKRKAPRQGAL